MFDLSIPKLLILAIIGLMIFGPEQLPKIASQAGRALRDLRRVAEGAKNELREGLGPEFAGFEIEDLNPRRFVQKHSPATWTRTTEPSSSPRARPRRTARSSRRANRPTRPLTTKTKRSPSDPRSRC